ncbi:MAG: hypothetical protein QMD00_03880, partial [Hadesarchaea archaeon]|nr:hypothetical protein [Hadesarchaea archaeon]
AENSLGTTTVDNYVNEYSITKGSVDNFDNMKDDNPNSWATLHEADPGRAIAVYRSSTGNGVNYPKYRVWDGSSWSAENELPTAGSPIRYIRTVFSPVEPEEMIAVTLSDDGYLDAYVRLDNNTWQVTNDIGQVNLGGAGPEKWRSFDIAYENVSGDAILVYSTGYSNDTGSPPQVNYRIWNHTANSWSDNYGLGITVFPAANAARAISLASQPGSDNIAFVTMGSADDTVGAIWDGSSWVDQKMILNDSDAGGGAENRHQFDVAFESVTRRAIVAVERVTDYVSYIKWTPGTGWDSTYTDINIPNQAGPSYYIVLAPHPTTDNIYLATVDSGSDLNTARWNGSTWTVDATEHDAGVDSNITRCFDIEWEPDGSRLLMVYGTAAGSIHYKVWSGEADFGAVAASSKAATGAHYAVELDRNWVYSAGDNKILGLMLNGNIDLGGLGWTDSTLTNLGDAAFTADVGTTLHRPYDIAYQRTLAGAPTYAMDIKMAIRGTPADASSRELQIRYQRTNTNDSFRLQVWQWGSSTWENRLTLDQTSWYQDNYTLLSGERADNGDVRVRFLDLDPSLTSSTDLQVDFLRVRNTVPLTDNYRLNWEHQITNVTTDYENYKVRVYGYAGSDETVGVYIWKNQSGTWSWYLIGNLPTAAGWVEKLILRDNIGDNLDNYLVSNSLRLRYYQNDPDSTQTTIRIDYVVCEEVSAAPVPGWAEIRATSPLNYRRPYDNSEDLKANTLWSTDNAQNWTTQNYQPVYLLENSASPEGNPYVSASYYSIYGLNRGGENFTVSGGDKQVVRVRAYVDTDSTPADHLYFAIRDSSNVDVITGTLVENTSAPSSFSWVQKDITSTTLTDGASYRFILYSPGSDSGAPWKLAAPSTSASDAIYISTTYRGTSAVATVSTDGGSSWVDNSQRDAVYSVMPGTATYRPSGYLQSSWYEPQPGESVDWGTITFTTSLPPGTDENVFVQVSNDNTVGWAASGGPYTSGGSIGLSGRYCRYRVYLSTNVDTSTPRFDDISINWSTSGAAAWITLRVSTPLNAFMSYDNYPDNANVLYSADGSSWTERGNQPIYVLDVDTNANGAVDAHEGNPYDENGAYEIYGDKYAGVRFTMGSEVTGKSKVTRGVWMLVRRLGSPPNNLNYTLYDLSEGRELASGQAATTTLPTSWTWCYVSFETALAEGRSYRLYLSTTGGDAGNCYQWMAPGRNVTYKSGVIDRATYDGTNTYGTTSATAGAGWTDNTWRDVIFRFEVADSFTTSGWLESSVYDAEDTVDWTSLSVSSSLSAGTSVVARVRAGDTENAYDGTWSSWTTDVGSLYNTRYIQYRLELSTTDPSTTPVVHQVTVNYQAVPPTPGPLVQTWIQTSREDFLAGREPSALGANIELMTPGDVTLRAAKYWGNEFYSTSGYSPKTKLDNPNKMFSYRFVAKPRTGVTSEGVYYLRILCQVTNKGEVRGPGDSLKEADDDNWWRIRICNDNNGLPNLSSVIAENFDHPSKSWSWEWFMPYPRMEVRFQPLAQLTPGNTYHIVIDANPAKSYVSCENYIIPVALKPRHPDNQWINNENFNTNRGVLFNDGAGGGWQDSSDPLSVTYNREPVYVLSLDTDGDNKYDVHEGNPFYKSSQETWGHYYHGERIVVKKDYGNFAGDNLKVGAVEFFAKAVGKPGGVYVRLSGLTEEVLAGPLDISDFNWNWVRATFPSPLTLWENETYELYLLSPDSDSSNYVDVQTMKTSWAYQYAYVPCTYGGDSSIYLYSEDGQTWSSKAYRELPFRFVVGYAGPDNFVSSVFDAEQTVDWRYIEWDATRPHGTSVNVYVRAGGSPDLSGKSWSGPFTGGRGDLSTIANSRYIQYMVELLPNSSSTAAPAVHEVRIGYRGGLGSIRLGTRTTQYPQQQWVYEGGAVILAQNKANVMYFPPNNMIVVTNNGMTGDNLKVTVNYRMIERLVGGAMATGGITVVREENRHTVENKYTDKVEVTMVTDYTQAWRDYFETLARQLNLTYGANAEVWVGTGDEVGVVRLTIYGKLGQGNPTNDIYYYEVVTPYKIPAI